ncbi:hypothetical protein SDC9_160727 [bioreactor metagenome]|uniref:Uncharacterized protein n=1 Tax=bioreactor metagenome TaxID=1076179 RepID=A0A645FIE2_9ZZZZ
MLNINVLFNFNMNLFINFILKFYNLLFIGFNINPITDLIRVFFYKFIRRMNNFPMPINIMANLCLDFLILMISNIELIFFIVIPICFLVIYSISFAYYIKSLTNM